MKALNDPEQNIFTGFMFVFFSCLKLFIWQGYLTRRKATQQNKNRDCQEAIRGRSHRRGPMQSAFVTITLIAIYC
jgi:hypothetical protein